MSEIRWLVLVPGPVKGSAVLLCDASGMPIEIHAPDRATAAAMATKRHDPPPKARLVSRLDYEQERQEQQHAESRGAARRGPA